jgi:hypothetical protein
MTGPGALLDSTLTALYASICAEGGEPHWETKRSAEARSCLAPGVNSIQLLWQQDEWRVLSLLWGEEIEEQPLDVQQLLAAERAHVRVP